ncbi:MAG: hypothetical protein UY94_C0007G0005 [Parcubacteria group bacterium GW2011_GWA2_56_21]|nr:MAG: hypothetical protein UY94_C0007G0005 [Parcubacteria group bacterium GW2011_GWA2_56_21]
MAETKQKAAATQNFVPVKEIRDGIMILKDGSLRAVLMASSLNFALKSADEQQGILLQFQNFLNSLEFPTQIFIQSRKLDIRPYIALLEERYKAQTDDLMRIQVREYIDFIKSFTENVNIMSKNFFIVVPYSSGAFTADTKILGILSSAKKQDIAAKKETFENNRSQLEQRISIVEEGLLRTGVRVAQLGTEEVIELLYKLFNPGELEKPMQLVKEEAGAQKT